MGFPLFDELEGGVVDWFVNGYHHWFSCFVIENLQKKTPFQIENAFKIWVSQRRGLCARYGD